MARETVIKLLEIRDSRRKVDFRMADHWFWAAVRILGKNSWVKIELSVLELGCGLTVRNWRNGHWFLPSSFCIFVKKNWKRREEDKLMSKKLPSSSWIYFDFQLPVVHRSYRYMSIIYSLDQFDICVLNWKFRRLMYVDRQPSSTYTSKRLPSIAVEVSGQFLYVTVTLTGDFDCIISLWLTVFFPLFIYQLFCTVRFNGEDLISIVNIDCFNIFYFWISQSLLS